MSDPGLEEAVKDRISFIRFSGFSISGTLPDHSTICRFRNALLEHNLFERLFEEINRQLEERGILAVHQGSGGLLRRANLLAKGSLITAAREKCMVVSAEHVRMASTEIF